MTVESFDAANIITVTASAAEHFASQINKKNARAIRLSLQQAGCTGYKYIVDEVESPEDDDISVTLENDVVLYIDRQHAPHFSGVIIDYKVEGLNKNLVLNNPNVAEACGCGESVIFS